MFSFDVTLPEHASAIDYADEISKTGVRPSHLRRFGHDGLLICEMSREPAAALLRFELCDRVELERARRTQ